jgi:hypothetical protein
MLLQYILYSCSLCSDQTKCRQKMTKDDHQIISMPTSTVTKKVRPTHTHTHTHTHQHTHTHTHTHQHTHNNLQHCLSLLIPVEHLLFATTIDLILGKNKQAKHLIFDPYHLILTKIDEADVTALRAYR